MRALICFCLLLVPLAGRAGDGTPGRSTLHLTLEKAIRMALEKNYSIRVETFLPQIAQNGIRRELGVFDPVFSGDYEHGETTNRFATDGGLGSQHDLVSTGFSGYTPWGLRYGLGLESNNLRGSGGGFSNNFDTKPSVTLTQPLLQGFGPTAALYRVRLARRDQQISQWALRSLVIEVVSRIAGTYNELFFARENLRVSEQSESLAQQLLGDNQRRTEIGTMSPLDVTTARAEVAKRHKAVILNAGSARDNEMLVAQFITDRLETLLDTRVEIAPPPTPVLAVDSLAGCRDALAFRPDYRQALLALEQQHITLAFEKNQALPRLDLTGSLSLLGLDNGALGSLGNALNRNQTDWTAGAIFSVPIPNRAGRARIDTAKLQIARALVDLKRLEQDIIGNVDRAARSIGTSRASVKAAEEATVLAKESLDASAEKLRAGAATTYEVLQLQRDFSQAEADEARARADFNQAVIEFDRQTGTTLLRNRITVE